MDPSVTERLTRRVLEGMEYETNRSGPPDDFPRLPRIPGGRYNDPSFLGTPRSMEADLALRLSLGRVAARG